MERKYFIPFGATADHSIDYLLGIIEDARITTISRVHDLSKEQLHWQYAEGWNTVGALLSHIVSARHFFRIGDIEERKLTETENNLYLPGLEMGKYIPQLITDDPVDVYLEKLKESNELLVEAVLKIKTEQFFEERKDSPDEPGCNLAWLLYHLAEDEVHHRGQITIINKLYKNIVGD